MSKNRKKNSDSEGDARQSAEERGGISRRALLTGGAGALRWRWRPVRSACAPR